jgi:cytochrome c peroxidase
MKYVITIGLFICLGFLACETASKELNSDTLVDNPSHLSNDTLALRIQLGKEFFNDVRLSRDNTISCTSCHHKDAAFSDTSQFSVGIDGQLTIRNSLPLFNLDKHTSFFRDGGSPTLEMQVVSPIENPIEMDMNLIELCTKLDSIESYHNQAKLAFGMVVNPFVITRSLAAYLRTFKSLNSRYDQFLKGSNKALTDIEKQGFDLFMTKANCISCHSGFNLSNNTFQNNGLYREYQDKGRFVITQVDGDKGKFIVQSLRNVELTAPYMHDGSISTLDEVVDHYVSGGADHVNKSDLIQPLDLTADEKFSLVSFLKSLTDDIFTEE